MRSILTVCLTLMVSMPSLHAEDKAAPKYEFKLKAVALGRADSTLIQLQKHRYNAAIELAQDLLLRIDAGKDTAQQLNEAMDMLVAAGLDLFTDAKTRLALLEESVTFLKFIEHINGVRFENGQVARMEVSRARYYRATAEVRLLREKEMKRP